MPGLPRGKHVLKRAILPLVIGALLVSSASAQKVKVEYDKSVDFSKYKTYAWMERGAETRPLLHALLTAAIEEHLASRGLTKTEKDPGLLLNYVGAVDPSTAFATVPVYPSYGGAPPASGSTPWTGGSSAGALAYVPEGTIIIDLLDANEKRLIWRGRSKTKLDPERKSESLERLDKMVEKITSHYPPPLPEKRKSD